MHIYIATICFKRSSRFYIWCSKLWQRIQHGWDASQICICIFWSEMLLLLATEVSFSLRFWLLEFRATKRGSPWALTWTWFCSARIRNNAPTRISKFIAKSDLLSINPFIASISSKLDSKNTLYVLWGIILYFS